MTIKTKDNMKKKLVQIMRKSLVVPLPDEQVDGIDKVCQSYLNEMDFVLADRFIDVFVVDKEDEDLENELIEKIQESLPELGGVTRFIFKACCMYIIWLAVVSDELDEATKAGISLMVKNAMLQRKNSLQELPAIEVMMDFYDVWENYLASEIPDVNTDDSMNLANEVLKDTDYFTSNAISEDNRDIIRRWAYDSVSTTMLEAFNRKKDTYLSEESLTDRMTAAVRDWIKNLPSMKMDTDGIRHIITLFEKEELNQTYSIKDLVDKLAEYELPLGEDDVLYSSVLISALDDDGLKEEIGNIKLTLLEYGIYLYYELVAEKLKEE